MRLEHILDMHRIGGAALRLVAAVALLATAGCKFEHDPQTKITLEITGVTTDARRDHIKETVKHWTDGRRSKMSTMHAGDKLTIELSPVSDVDAFVKKIDFGEVTKIEDRKFAVVLREP